MEKVITVDIADKNDLVEKYDRSIVSADLIRFILAQAELASHKDTFKIIYKCEKCGELHKNIMANDDNFDLIIELSKNPSSFVVMNPPSSTLTIFGEPVDPIMMSE